MSRVEGDKHELTCGHDGCRRVIEEQARRLEGVTAHRDGLYRVMRALAEDDRSWLAEVDERIQADVDAIVVERISNREHIAELEVACEMYREAHGEHAELTARVAELERLLQDTVLDAAIYIACAASFIDHRMLRDKGRELLAALEAAQFVPKESP